MLIIIITVLIIILILIIRQHKKRNYNHWKGSRVLKYRIKKLFTLKKFLYFKQSIIKLCKKKGN